jgi:hypothetical protein
VWLALCGRAGRITAKSGGFRPGQWSTPRCWTGSAARRRPQGCQRTRGPRGGGRPPWPGNSVYAIDSRIITPLRRPLNAHGVWWARPSYRRPSPLADRRHPRLVVPAGRAFGLVREDARAGAATVSFEQLYFSPADGAPPRASAQPEAPLTKIVQGRAKLWANFRALIGIFSQSVGPSLAIWANPVQFSSLVCVASRARPARNRTARRVALAATRT